MRYAICYISTAVKDLPVDEVQNLFHHAGEKNRKNDVKGILLYSKGNFFQVLEGNKEYVMSLFSIIEEDPRHHTIIQVVGKEISQGAFDGYEFDVVTENNKYDPNLLKDYLEPLKGMDTKVQDVVQNILEVFIDTRV